MNTPDTVFFFFIAKIVSSFFLGLGINSNERLGRIEKRVGGLHLQIEKNMEKIETTKNPMKLHSFRESNVGK